jgi:hypothetical protein
MRTHLHCSKEQPKNKCTGFLSPFGILPSVTRKPACRLRICRNSQRPDVLYDEKLADQTISVRKKFLQKESHKIQRIRLHEDA